MLNLASLLMGLGAWGLGFTAIRKNGSYPLTLGSFTFCGVALAAQFFEINRRVALSDWTALMDTVPTLTKVVSVLLIVTAALNVIALWKGREAR